MPASVCVGEGKGQLQGWGVQGRVSEVCRILNFEAQGSIWRRGHSGGRPGRSEWDVPRQYFPGPQPHTPFLPCPL